MIDWNAMSDADFRREMRQFFEAEYPEELRHLPHRPRFAEIEHWHRKLHANGWVAPAWPTEYGGMGLSASKLLIFYEEQQRWGVNRGRDMGVQMVGPLIIKFGTEAQKAYWLPRILSCKDIWCQGYSEPGAGVFSRESGATRCSGAGPRCTFFGSRCSSTPPCATSCRSIRCCA